jgi:hypothetical protein
LQLPQLFTLLFVLMQLLEQHCCAPVHVRAQAPQLATDELVSTHVLLQHIIVPPPQLAWEPHMQVPPTHVSPAAHPPAHVAGGVQTPPTHVSVPVHAAPVPQWQTPVAHVSPAWHAGEHPGVPVSRPPSRPPSLGPPSCGPVSGVTPVSGAAFVSGVGPVSCRPVSPPPSWTFASIGLPRPVSGGPPSPPRAQPTLAIERTLSSTNETRASIVAPGPPQHTSATMRILTLRGIRNQARLRTQ